MLAFVVLAAICIPLIALICGSLWLRRASLSLADGFLLAIALFMGAHTLVNAGLGGTYGIDALVVFELFIGVCLSAMVVWLYTKAAPRRTLAHVSATTLAADLLSCPGWQVIAVLACGVAYRLYSMVVLSQLGATNVGQIYDAESELGLPYWYTSANMVMPFIMFAASLSAWMKTLQSRRFVRVFWLAALLIGLFYFFGMGRRPFISLVEMLFLVYIANAGGRVKLGRMAAVLALCVPALFLVSNLYQGYRLVSYAGVPVTDVSLDDMQTLLNDATQAESTLSNIEERPTLWRFSYDVLKAHTDGRSAQLGKLFIIELGNYVPAFLNPDKEYLSSETETQRAFGLDEIDTSGNIFAFTYADFGHLGPLVAGLLMVLYVWVCSRLMRRLRDPFLRITLLAGAFFYVLNFEADYTLPLKHLRDFAGMALIYVSIRYAWRSWRTLLRTASEGPAQDLAS